MAFNNQPDYADYSALKCPVIESDEEEEEEKHTNYYEAEIKGLEENRREIAVQLTVLKKRLKASWDEALKYLKDADENIAALKREQLAEMVWERQLLEENEKKKDEGEWECERCGEGGKANDGAIKCRCGEEGVWSDDEQ